MNIIVCAALLGLAGAPAHADSFTSAQVLQWDKKSQDAYFLASVTMAGVVAAQNPGERAKCVDDWYLATPQTKETRNNEFRSAMRKYPNYHPAGVMIAVLEKACGSFDFTTYD